MPSDDHNAEARRLLAWVIDEIHDGGTPTQSLQLATAHALTALLDQRPRLQMRSEVETERDDWQAACRNVETERDEALAQVSDLRWLVGHLAHSAPDTLMLPPRLAPLVRECMDGYEPGRYTLAPAGLSIGGDQGSCEHCGHARHLDVACTATLPGGGYCICLGAGPVNVETGEATKVPDVPEVQDRLDQLLADVPWRREFSDEAIGLAGWLLVQLGEARPLPGDVVDAEIVDEPLKHGGDDAR